MNTNIKKTKIVIFQERALATRLDHSKFKHQFYTNNEKIEITNSYTYLGVKLSTNSSFKEHKAPKRQSQEIHNYLQLVSTLTFLYFQQVFLTIFFNSLYPPILMYGSEVWNIYDKDDYNSQENDIIEKTKIQFCTKQVLGVNRQCPNVAYRNEFGRLPLKKITNVNIIKFWIHLENKQDDNCAEHCSKISIDMAEKNQTSLMKKVNTLCKNSNLNELYLNDNNSSTYIKNIQLTIRVELTSHQYNLIRNNQKLKFYSIFKNDCHKSHCLNIITNIS